MNEENLTVRLVDRQLKEFREDFTELRGDLKDILKEVAFAVNKLVALESTQAAMTQAYTRLERQLEKTENKFEDLEKRVDSLEKEAPMQKQTSTWVVKALWGVAAAGAVAVGKFLGIY